MTIGVGGRLPNSNIGVGVAVGCPAVGCGGCLLVVVFGGMVSAVTSGIAALAHNWILAAGVGVVAVATVLTVIFTSRHDKSLHEPHKVPGGYNPQCGWCVRELREAQAEAEAQEAAEQAAAEQRRKEQRDAAEWDRLNGK